MKCKKVISVVIALAMMLSMFVSSVSAESIYTEANGWTLGGAIEQSDGTLKLGKGSSRAATFTPDLEYGKVYEITYDVTGLEVVSGSWTKPFTVTLSAGGQTESNVLTYRMAGAWRDITTDQKYVAGSNGQNKIIIDTKTGEWKAYALGTKATYSGHTSSANSKTRAYNKFSDTSDFKISFYAYDNKDDYTAASISNVTVTQISASISISATAEGNGTVKGSGVYDIGESVTLMATPVVAGTFLGWYDGDTKVSDKTNYTFTVTESKTYVAKFSTDTKEYETLILACTDFQNQTSSEEGAKTVTSIVESVKRSGFENADAFFCCGDYSNSYNTTAENLPYLKNAVIDFVPDEARHIYVQGNHDSAMGTEGLTQSGDNDPESGEYGVFVINEDDYMWYNSDVIRIAQTAENLADYLNEKLEENYKKPIFVLSHIPLYKSLRTTDSGDAQHANQLFYVLNQAGEKGLNVIFMSGHDHSSGYESYLGGSAVYLAKGDHINIPQGSTTDFKEETLNFTYMNAGYVGYYAAASGRDSTLNMTLFGIDEETDSVDIYRYDANGLHNLKSAGVLRTGEVTSGEYKADTTVYTSPQAVCLTDVNYDDDIKPLFHAVAITVVGSGVVTGEDLYIPGDNATLTATPNYGYEFAGWYDGDVKVSDDETYTFPVTEAKRYTAKFDQTEPNLLYTSEKGWTLVDAAEQADGSFMLNNDGATFTPMLEAGKKYSIKFDVTGLETDEANPWHYQFRLALISGGTTLDGALSYRQAGIWENGNESKWVASGTNGEIEVIVDKETGEYEMYALGALSARGTFADTSDFTLKFYKWSGNAPFISNVAVEEIEDDLFTDVYYKEDFENTTSEEWTAKWHSNSQITGQVTYAWGDEFTTLADGNNVLRKWSGDAYWFDSTPQTGTYKLKFDIMPAATTAAANTTVFRMDIIARWIEGVNLAFATDASGNVNKLTFYEQTATIDPTEWVTIELIRNFATGTATATATQGDIVLTGTDSGTYMKTSMDVNSSGFTGVYLDNITVEDVVSEEPENIIYTPENGWTVNSAVEQEDGSLKLDVNQETAALFKPALEEDKKYSIKFDVTGLETDEANPWHYQFRLALISRGTTLDGALSYRQAGIWENGNEKKYVAGGTDGEIEIIIDKETGEYEMYALGALSARGTFADTSDFTLKFYKWSGNAPYISNVTVEEFFEPVIYTHENGWTLLEDGMSASEQADGSLKIGKGASNAAQFTPDLEYGKAYEITYDVSGLEVVAGSWKKPITVTLSAGGQTESNVLTYRMVGAWRDLTTDEKYADGSNGTNKIIIDTTTGEWETYALGEKATYSGYTTIINGKIKTYNEFTDTSDFTISFYAYDKSDDFTTPCISNVAVKEIEPTDYTDEKPILSTYKFKVNGNEVDSPRGLKEFDIELTFKPEARKRGKVAVLAGVYDNSETLLSTGYTGKTITAVDNSITVNMCLDTPYTTDDACKVFVWDGLDSMRPLLPVIYPTEKIILNPIADGVDLHNDLMEAYLEDSYENVAEYAWGGMDKDDPKFVKFMWASDNDYSSYKFEISENEDMSDAREIVTDKKSCEVYNLKVGTRYYWRVSASDENETSVTSYVSSFTTKEDAPRYIQVEGLTNGRDVGGWSTVDGKKVKQGMIYRSYCFDYVKDNKTVTLVTSNGIDTLVNTLGIKTELDLRSESSKTSSILGEGVNYFRYGMNYNDDMLSGNKGTIKNVFNLLADNSNYPIIWHCQAGADRTGVMTYLLNGLLGVSKEDLLRDYLLTNFAINDNSSRELAGIESKYVKTLDEYEGNALSEKIYNYLNIEIGVSTENLDKIKYYMIEE